MRKHRGKEPNEDTESELMQITALCTTQRNRSLQDAAAGRQPTLSGKPKYIRNLLNRQNGQDSGETVSGTQTKGEDSKSKSEASQGYCRNQKVS